MSAGFALLCIVAGVVPVAILYVLFGPTRSRPLVVMPRASLLAIPHPSRRGSYSPERAFAAEHAGLIANVARLVPVVARPRPPIPPPPPRSRQARGSDAPPARLSTRREDPTEPNPFTDEGPTHLG